MKKRITGLAVLAAVLLQATPVAAQTAKVDTSAPGVFADNIFILICAIFVIFMQLSLIHI